MTPREFFDTYVFGHLCKDIERELALRKAGGDAGAFLCALGLLAYTEYMGSLDPKVGRTASATVRFEAFFRRMGPPYASLLNTHDIYDLFRCGFIHEYFAKTWCTVYMLNSGGPLPVAGYQDTSGGVTRQVPSVNVGRPVPAGIGLATNGAFYFVIEKYYEDFRQACVDLLAELERPQSPTTLLPVGPVTASS